MAKKIQRGDLVRALQRRYGLVGRTGFVLDEVIVPTVALDDLTDISTPELAGGQVHQGPGAAGERSMVELANDQGAGLLLRVRKILVWLTNEADETRITAGFSGTGLPAPTVGLARYLDARIDRVPPVGVRGEANAAPPALDTFFQARIDGENPLLWEPEAMFIPDAFMLRLQPFENDQGLGAYFEWEEIPPDLVA